VTKENQLQVGLLVCAAALRALIRTHPNKEALRGELEERFAALEATSDETLGQQQRAHMKIAMDAFLWPLDH
jgi:hypothetical protein